MTTPLSPLDEIVANLPREKIAALIAALAARLLAEPPVVGSNDHGNGTTTLELDTTLSVAEVAKLLKRTPRWVWRSQRKLPFLRRIGGRGLLASRRELERWLAGQKNK